MTGDGTVRLFAKGESNVTIVGVAGESIEVVVRRLGEDAKPNGCEDSAGPSSLNESPFEQSRLRQVSSSPESHALANRRSSTGRTENALRNIASC